MSSSRHRATTRHQTNRPPYDPAKPESASAVARYATAAANRFVGRGELGYLPFVAVVDAERLPLPFDVLALAVVAVCPATRHQAKGWPGSVGGFVILKILVGKGVSIAV